MHMQPLTQGGALPKTNAQEDYAVAMKDNHGAADGNQRCAAPAGNHTICLLHDTLSTIYLQPAARDKPIKTSQKALHLSPNTKLSRLAKKTKVMPADAPAQNPAWGPYASLSHTKEL
jgi:hypothetical protein